MAASISAEAAARRSRQDGVGLAESVEPASASVAAGLADAGVRRVVERDEAGLRGVAAVLAAPASPGNEASVDWNPLSKSSMDRPLDGAASAADADDLALERGVDGNSEFGSDKAASVDAKVANASSTGWDEAAGGVDAPAFWSSVGSTPSVRSSGFPAAISSPLSGTVAPNIAQKTMRSE